MIMKYNISIFVFLLLGTILIQCKKNNTLRIDSERESGSQISLRNFVRTSYQIDGKKEWVLKAEESFIFPKEDRTIFYNLNFTQFENDKVSSKLTGKRGEVNNTTKILTLEGDIFLITPDQKSLKTESLTYSIDKEELTTDDEVLIYSSGTTIAGKGLRAKKALNEFTVIKPSAITRGGENPFKKE